VQSPYLAIINKQAQLMSRAAAEMGFTPVSRSRVALAAETKEEFDADAIRYGLRHWDGLTRFLDDGRIEIDSNTVERSIRPIALNRKNALFAGSDEGGVH
jgi:transposase